MRLWPARMFPFAYKMMIPYLLLIMLTHLTIGFFSYRTALQSRTELIESNVSRTLQQMRDHIHYKMQDLEAVADSLFSSPSFQRYLEVTGDSLEVYETTSRQLLPIMETSVGKSIQNMRLIVYVNNTLINEIYSDMNKKINDKTYHILSASRLKNESLEGVLLHNDLDKRWLQMESDEEQGNISLFQQLISFQDYKTVVGYLRISVPLESLFLHAAEHDDGAIVRVINQIDDRIMMQTADTSALQDPIGALSIQEEIPGTGFVLECIIPADIVAQDVDRIGRITLLVCGISFFIAATIGFVVARYNRRKMLRIVAYMRKFQYGQSTETIPYHGNDEFAQISAAFNQMTFHIQELLKEVYRRGIEKKGHELQALQAQINPHFLYNTLSSIKSLAHIGQTEQLSRMVSELTNFYRLTLNHGRVVISMQDEISQVKAYLDIQSIKYADRFTVSYSIDPAIVSCQTLKLILQPFVENIFMHAWFDEHIHIRVVGSRDGECVVLKVIDNGIGMTEQKLRDLSNNIQPGNYGIRNVKERIQLHYGYRYGVELFSKQGIGTTVKISIPYILHDAKKGAADNELSIITR